MVINITTFMELCQIYVENNANTQLVFLFGTLFSITISVQNIYPSLFSGDRYLILAGLCECQCCCVVKFSSFAAKVSPYPVLFFPFIILWLFFEMTKGSYQKWIKGVPLFCLSTAVYM